MRINDKYSWAKHLDFAIIDLGSLLLSFLLSYYLKFQTLEMSGEWKRLMIFGALINIIIALVSNPYSGIFHRRYYNEIGRTVLLVLSNALCMALLFYALKIGSTYSREVMLYTYAFYYLVTLVLKYIWKKLLLTGIVKVSRADKIPLFLICYEENAEKNIHSVYSTDLPLYDIKGVYFVDGGAESESSLKLKYYKQSFDIPVVSCDYVKYIFDNNIEEVLVCVPLDRISTDDYQTLIANGVGLNLAIESTLGFQTEEQFVSEIGVNKVLSLGMFYFSPAQQFYLFVKRIFDILCGLIGLLIFIPVTLAVKLAYLFSGDTAKVLYKQKRVGLNGRIIWIWKYRSMVPNAGEMLKELLKDEKYKKEWDENQKFENDPRITKVGAFLRKTSIDELPQLLNVLHGEMSLVGPRPLVEGELEKFDGLQLYQRVKPGITGWWGCNGRSNIDYHERLELEYYYVKNCSLYLDLICILRTIVAIVKKDGAK